MGPRFMWCVRNYKPNTHSAKAADSSADTALGGMGIGPQVPELPFWMLAAKFSAAPSTSAFLAATSFSAGPTSFVSTVWHATQPLLLKRASASAASAGCATIAAPSANIGISNFFIVMPLYLGNHLTHLPSYYTLLDGTTHAKAKRFTMFIT